LPAPAAGGNLVSMNERADSLGTALDDAIARGVAIVSLIGIALIHVLQLPEAFDETFYLGLLFIGAVVASLLVTIVLTRHSDRRTWQLAGVLPALILIGYVLSRTSGLPAANDDVDNWTEPLGLVSLVAEGLLVCLSAGVLGRRRRAASGAAARRQKPSGQPAAGLG
jgi:hypothetical protein